MLSFDDPLPFAPERVLVCGVTGVGKSTLAATLASSWNLHYTELDSLYHGPDWTVRPTFEADLRAIAAAPRWVSEWGYWGSGVADVLGDRAQLLVWLDLPRRVALPRLLRRTVRRSIRREVLWNGNIEPPLHTFFTRPDDHILRWEMKTHGTWELRMPEVQQRYPHLTIVRLRRSGDVDAWLRGPAAR